MRGLVEAANVIVECHVDVQFLKSGYLECGSNGKDIRRDGLLLELKFIENLPAGPNRPSKPPSGSPLPSDVASSSALIIP